MLSEPMEILEIGDGMSIPLRIIRWEKDEAIIRPAHAPQGKGVPVLRVHVPPEDKAASPYYWDITGKGAVALLMPYLSQPGYDHKTFVLSAVGVAPKKRFSLEVKS
jgi:hypothetical protein